MTHWHLIIMYTTSILSTVILLLLSDTLCCKFPGVWFAQQEGIPISPKGTTLEDVHQPVIFDLLKIRK